MADITFKALIEAAHKEEQILTIKKDGKKASGIYVPNAVFAYKDSGTSVVSYVDTGVFVLFARSNASDTVDQKYERYIGKDRKTKREIIFQSRNAAAQFVLGEAGRANHWKKISPEK